MTTVLNWWFDSKRIEQAVDRIYNERLFWVCLEQGYSKLEGGKL